MNHQLVEVVARYLVWSLVVMLPILVTLFTDRFRQRPSPEQYGVLFAVAALIGVFLFLPVISVVAGTALAAMGIAWLSGRYALSGVSVESTLSTARLFPDETADFVVQVDNWKPLPLAWLSIVNPIHHGLVRPGKDVHDMLEFSGGVQLLDTLGHALVIRTAVGPFRRLRRTYRVTALRRGVYRVGPAEVEAGDPFGIFRRQAILGRSSEIVVYPRIHGAGEVNLPFLEAIGEATTRRALLEDPILLAGSREYRPGDPLHRMHWKATARTGELQVRTADPSTTAQILLVLNLNTFQHVWQGVDLDRMESTIEVAASVGLWALDRGFAVGLRSNGILPGVDNTPVLPPSASPGQPAQLLEHLARLSFSGRFSAESVLDEESRRLHAGVSIVFVTSIITPEIIAALTTRRLARRVSVVYCGRFAAPVIRGVPIQLITPPPELRRAAS